MCVFVCFVCFLLHFFLQLSCLMISQIVNLSQWSYRVGWSQCMHSVMLAVYSTTLINGLLLYNGNSLALFSNGAAPTRPLQISRHQAQPPYLPVPIYLQIIYNDESQDISVCIYLSVCLSIYLPPAPTQGDHHLRHVIFISPHVDPAADLCLERPKP